MASEGGKKTELSNPKNRLLSPQIIPERKKNNITSYHLTHSSIKNSAPIKTRQQNNFMSIIEPKGKDIINPKSQSVLQDYNIKYEKKQNDNSLISHSKKKSENNKGTPLSKLIKGNQQNSKTGQNNMRVEEISRFLIKWPKINNFSRKEEKDNSKLKLNNDSFGNFPKFS